MLPRALWLAFRRRNAAARSVHGATAGVSDGSAANAVPAPQQALPQWFATRPASLLARQASLLTLPHCLQQAAPRSLPAGVRTQYVAAATTTSTPPGSGKRSAAAECATDEQPKRERVGVGGSSSGAEAGPRNNTTGSLDIKIGSSSGGGGGGSGCSSRKSTKCSSTGELICGHFLQSLRLP
jgi:hypothetical protein